MSWFNHVRQESEELLQEEVDLCPSEGLQKLSGPQLFTVPLAQEASGSFLRAKSFRLTVIRQRVATEKRDERVVFGTSATSSRAHHGETFDHVPFFCISPTLQTATCWGDRVRL